MKTGAEKSLDIMSGIASETVDIVYLSLPSCLNWECREINPEWFDLIRQEMPDMYAVLPKIRESGPNLTFHEYITYMSPRVREAHRVLKPTGVLFAHSDATTGHYIHLVLKEIFGEANYKKVLRFFHTIGECTRPHEIAAYQKTNESYFMKNDDTMFELWVESEEYRSLLPVEKAHQLLKDSINPEGKTYLLDVFGLWAPLREAMERLKSQNCDIELVE